MAAIAILFANIGLPTAFGARRFCCGLSGNFFKLTWQEVLSFLPINPSIFKQIATMVKQRILLLSVFFTALMGCKTNQLGQSTSPTVGMIKVSILYPNEKGKTFDMDYYEKKHMPMMAEILGKNLKFYEIDKGIAGRTPSDEVPFVAIGYFYCTDLSEYNNAVRQNIDAIRNDIVKYTNIQPTIQVSEVRKVQFNAAR